MTIALVTALLLLRPMDCFGLAAMSQEAAECCLKGLCHHAGASDADCCKIDSHDSASLAQPSIKDSGCKVSVLVAVAVEPVKSISDHAWFTLPAGASREVDTLPCEGTADGAPHTAMLIGNVATQIAVPRNMAQPSPSSDTRGPLERRRVLMPAKNSDAANSTTASM